MPFVPARLFLLMSVVGCVIAIVAFATSPARRQTLNKMAVAFAAALAVAIAVGLLIPVAMGMVIGGFHSPSQRTGVIAEFSTSVALIYASLMGQLHVGELKQLARFREERSRGKVRGKSDYKREATE
jgi:hypothetical protein